MQPVETTRCVIRDYTLEDLDAAQRLQAECFDANPDTLKETQDWLMWTVANYRNLSRLYQPPYGDYLITLKDSGELIGSVGLVQTIVPWRVLPEFRGADKRDELVQPEFGLFWGIYPAYQRQGYAVEAAKGMIDFVFDVLHSRRVVATTERDNFASQAVMKKLGMSIYRNPTDEPFWFQVVGVLENEG
ncbi:MAG: GNAT family N-acetyltransferase [Anaerolineae bacterium]|nr:GNAT family N-acetyltransferase [Anaerolineae bacterium]